jgi:hypothetical protein
MTQQIEYFSGLKDQMSTRLSAGKVSALLSKSIFLISTGANDAFDFFSQNRSPDSTAIQQFSEAMISTYDSHVKVRTLVNSLYGRQIQTLLYVEGASQEV